MVKHELWIHNMIHYNNNHFDLTKSKNRLLLRIVCENQNNNNEYVDITLDLFYTFNKVRTSPVKYC